MYTRYSDVGHIRKKIICIAAVSFDKTRIESTGEYLQSLKVPGSMNAYNSAVKRRTTVTAYFSSEQVMLFVFAWQNFQAHAGVKF